MFPSDSSNAAERTLSQRQLGWLLVGFFVLAVNFTVWWLISAHVGGDPLGVRPSVDGFVLTEHGRKTPVSERTWCWLLLYTWLTLVLFPINIFGWGELVTSAKELRRRSTNPLRRTNIGPKVLSIWTVLWTFGVTARAATSFVDWLRIAR